MATKFGLTALNSKLFIIYYLFIFSTSYSKAKNENTTPCLRKLPSTKITMKHLIFLSMASTTRLISQKTWRNDTVETKQVSPKVFLSARKRDGTFYNKKSLTALRARF